MSEKGVNRKNSEAGCRHTNACEIFRVRQIQ